MPVRVSYRYLSGRLIPDILAILVECGGTEPRVKFRRCSRVADQAGSARPSRNAGCAPGLVARPCRCPADAARTGFPRTPPMNHSHDIMCQLSFSMIEWP